MTNSVEITLFRKKDGVLSKRISLNNEADIKSDGSECRMAEGSFAHQHRLNERDADFINKLHRGCGQPSDKEISLLNSVFRRVRRDAQ